MDAIDILPPGPAAYELWYRLLNCGFRIAPGGGTDVFTSHRGIRMMPGGARQYVETGPAMNWGKWIERFREGRNFVTNGPLLTFNVNGEPMGAAIRIPAGRPYRAKLSAEISSQVPLRRVEFIQNGNVIEGQNVPEGARSFRMEKEVAVESSCWFSVRVDGPPARGVYDDVRPAPEPRASDPADATVLANAKVRHGWGEPGYTLHQRVSARPALTFNGISGGYSGPVNG